MKCTWVPHPLGWDGIGLAPWPLVGHASRQNFWDRMNRIDKRGNDRNWYLARTFQPREGRRNLAQGDRREPWEKGKDSFFEIQPPKGATEITTEFKIKTDN